MAVVAAEAKTQKATGNERYKIQEFKSESEGGDYRQKLCHRLRVITYVVGRSYTVPSITLCGHM